MVVRNLVEEDNNDRDDLDDKDDDDDKRRDESWWQPLYWESNIWVRWTDHLAGLSTYLSDATVQVFVWYKLWPYLSDTSCTHICLIKAVQIFVWYKLYTYLCITKSTHICLTIVVHIFLSSHLYNNLTTQCLKYAYIQIANVACRCNFWHLNQDDNSSVSPSHYSPKTIQYCLLRFLLPKSKIWICQENPFDTSRKDPPVSFWVGHAPQILPTATPTSMSSKSIHMYSCLYISLSFGWKPKW